MTDKKNSKSGSGKFALSNPSLQSSALSNPLLSSKPSFLSSSLTGSSLRTNISSSPLGGHSTTLLGSKSHGSSLLTTSSLLSSTGRSSLLSRTGGTSSLLTSSTFRGLSTSSVLPATSVASNAKESKRKESKERKEEKVGRSSAGQKRRLAETDKENERKEAGQRELEKMLLGGDTYRPSYEASAIKLPTLGTENAKDTKRMRLSWESSADDYDMMRLQKWKMNLINKVSCSLIQEPNFKDPKNPALIDLRAAVTFEDFLDEQCCEFILKVALYCRQELNIRTTANFLLACAAYYPESRPHLRKYFGKTIVLPSDWIDVAEMYQTFHDKRIKWGALPSALRKVMNEKFKDFDEYQLAKYNKDKTKSKYKKRKQEEKRQERIAQARQKRRRMAPPEPPKRTVEKEEDDELKLRTYTLKQLIRHIHIREPATYVMSLLGKKYPESPDVFRTSRLPGNWDSDRAGKRMRLAVPETWETQVASRGNKAEVWESLLDHKKLPFMAMLRNLRNLIKAGLSDKHHEMVLKRLQDKHQVANSRQFPFRFLSAHEALDDLEKEFEETQKKLVDQALKRTSRTVYSRASARRSGIRKGKEKAVEESRYSKMTLDRYRKALAEAVKIAAKHNVPLIRGHTLLLCDVSSVMPCTSFRGGGKPRMVQDVAALLCLMCRQAACESSTLLYYNDPMYVHDWTSNSGGVLANAGMMVSRATAKGFDRSLRSCLQEILMMRKQVDNVLFLGSVDVEQSQNLGIRDFVDKYRATVNPRLVYFENAYKASSSNEVNMHSSLDVTVYGYSEQILRFLAQRGNAQLLEHVDSIDKMYNLDPSPLRASDVSESSLGLELTTRTPWRHITIFISSTFMDMHGERDIITRFVMPQLRERFFPHNILLDEVDLRWGLNEDPTSNTLECLRQVVKSNFFIGLLGERYGFCPKDYGWAETDEYFRSRLPWLEDYPAGRSLTEIEFMAGGLDPSTHSDLSKSVFFLRNPNSLRHLPAALRPCFVSDDSESVAKLQSLKHKLRASNLEVYDYDASYGGVFEHRPVMRELEEFAARVFAVLYQSIKEEVDLDDDMTECDFERVQEQQNDFLELERDKFVGRTRVVQELARAAGAAQGKILRLAGDRGCGKTSLMAVLADRLSEFSTPVVPFSVNASAFVTNISDVLQYLYCYLCRIFNLDYDSATIMDFSKLRRRFVETLEEIGRRTAVTLMIDGLDLLEDKMDVFTLNWLPATIPNNLRVIISCCKSHTLYSAAQRSDSVEFQIGPLEILDKGALVRANLVAFGKSLSEAAFNNQLKFITGKRESSSPLYLAIACEEIRMFGMFEKLDDKLKSLPQSLPQLLSEKMVRIEAENGQERVRLMLALLSVAKAELSFIDMRLLLALGSQSSKCDVMEMRRKISTIAPIPHFHLLQIVTSLQFLLQQNEKNLLKLNRTHATHLILGRLLGMTLTPYIQLAHRLLAGLFLERTNSSDPMTFDHFEFEDALESLPFHLLHGDSIEELKSVVTNLNFISALTAASRLKSLLEFSHEHVSGNRRLQKDWEIVKSSTDYCQILDFVRANLHVLQKYPQLLYQQACNTSHSSAIYSAAKSQRQSIPGLVTLEVISRDVSARRATPFTKHTDFSSPNTALSLSCSSGHVAVGNKDGTVLILQSHTAQLVRSLSGHGAAVTCVQFVSEAVLASGAEDGSIALWDVNLGVRTHFRHDPRRKCRVSSMTTWGAWLVTMEKDSELLVINSKDPKTTWTSSFPSVINSVHNNTASGGTVAAGLWNSSIVLYNLNTQSRVATFRGHNSSVQCVQYSNDAVHLASASLDGEVRLWHTKTGTRLGRFRPEAPSPMTDLNFSPDFLASTSESGTLFLWAPQLGRQTLCLGDESAGDSIEKDDAITCIRVEPEGRQLMAVGRHSGRLEVWNCSSGRLVDHSSESHVASLSDLSWGSWKNSPLALMTASADRTVTVVGVNGAGKLQGILAVYDGNSGVASIAWDERYCAFGRDDGSAEVREVISGQVVTLHHHSLKVTGVDILPRKHLLATVSLDMSIAIYNCCEMEDRDLKPLASKSSLHKDGMTCVSWDRSAQPGDDFFVIYTAANNGEVKISHLTNPLGDSPKFRQMMNLMAHEAPISCIYGEAPLIATGSADGHLKVWTKTGALVSTQKMNSRVSSCQILLPKDLAVSYDWASSEPGPVASVITTTSGEKRKVARDNILQTMLQVDSSSASLVQLICGTDRGSAHILRPFIPNPRLVLPLHTAPARAVCLSEDRAVTCGDDASVCEIPLRPNLSSRIATHMAHVTCFASHPNSPFFVTADSCGVLAVHQRSDTSRVCRIVTPDNAPILAATVVPVKRSFKVIFAAGLKIFTICPKSYDNLPDELNLSEEKDAVAMDLTTITNQRPTASMAYVSNRDLLCSDWDGKLNLHNKLSISLSRASKEMGSSIWITDLIYLERQNLVVGLANDFDKKFGLMSFYSNSYKSDPSSFISYWSAKIGRPTCMTKTPSENLLLIGTVKGNVLLACMDDGRSFGVLDLSDDGVSAICVLAEEKKEFSSIVFATGSENGNVRVWRVMIDTNQLASSFVEVEDDFLVCDEDMSDPPCFQQIGLYMNGIGISVLGRMNEYTFLLGDKQGNLDYLTMME